MGSTRRFRLTCKINKMQERMCSFCGGGLLNIMIIPWDQMGEVFLLGFIGGLAGIMAREVFSFIKNKLTK